MFEEIYHGFQSIKRKNGSVKFFNTYRSLPVCYSGKIIRIEGGRITFTTPKPQLICIRDTGSTFITGESLHSSLKAMVACISLRDEYVELTNFNFTLDTIGTRSYIRVETPRPISGACYNEMNMLFPIKILEISLRGLAVLLHKDLLIGKNFDIGRKFTFSYLLNCASHENEKIEYEGIIRNITLGKLQHFIRLGIETLPDPNTEVVLTKYLAQRQKELLREFKLICDNEVFF
jgi:hypothetical protein